MTRIKIIICLILALFAFETEMKAQDSTIFYGMNWYLKKSVAIEEARKQGKQIFLLWGKVTCPDCQWVKQKLSVPPFKDIIDENYVLWFSDNSVYKYDSEEVGIYLTFLKNVPLRYYPVNCIIDISDLTVAKRFMYGPEFSLNNTTEYSDEISQYHKELTELLNGSVGNDIIYNGNDSDVKIFVVGNNIIIKSKPLAETVSVYTLTGSLVDRFHKTEYEITRDLSMYPKGLLIFAGSSGWSQKVVL